MANFGHFAGFSDLLHQNEAQIDLEWPILPNLQLFPSLTTKVSHLWRNLKECYCWGRGGTSANCFEFFNFFKSSQHQSGSKWLTMVNFAKKSGLDWLKMANFGHFAGFSIFSPKMRLRLTWNGQFHPIHNFSHLLPPKCLIFGEISKIFIPWGVGVHWQIFWVFQLFEIISHQSSSKWPTMANFATKVA